MAGSCKLAEFEMLATGEIGPSSMYVHLSLDSKHPIPRAPSRAALSLVVKHEIVTFAR